MWLNGHWPALLSTVFVSMLLSDRRVGWVPAFHGSPGAAVKSFLRMAAIVARERAVKDKIYRLRSKAIFRLT
jgi:hypothetical protein